MTRQMRGRDLENGQLATGELQLPHHMNFTDWGYLVLTPGYLWQWSNRDLIFPHIIIWNTREAVGQAVEQHTYGRNEAQRLKRIWVAMWKGKNVAINDRTIQLPVPIAQIFQDPTFRGRLVTPSSDLLKVIITAKEWANKPFVWTAWWNL